MNVSLNLSDQQMQRFLRMLRDHGARNDLSFAWRSHADMVADVQGQLRSQGVDTMPHMSYLGHR